jgi:protoporphyrinogen/coproporphyrinogen III oxidase
MQRIAIIGGGISGLSAAFRLEHRRRQGAQLEYVLLESGPSFGGVVRTERVDDCLIEAGPDSFLTEKAWAADLCRELGLGDQLIGSNDADRKTYILVHGRLVPFPDGLMFMVPTNLWATVSSALFSWTTKLQMVREWLLKPASSTDDVSVAEFVNRHYGREMVDRVADPLLAGVYGGSADELSVRSVLPKFVEMEARHGSLGKAMTESKTRQGGSAKPLFTTLKNGMQQMTDALLSRIPESARRVNTPVEAVKPESGKWLVISDGRTEQFDAVILATPAYVAGMLLGSAHSELAEDLTSIPYSSSVTVTLGYDRSVRAALPPGFGLLVPRIENVRIIAATFVHNKFPNRAPHDKALIRFFLGGTRDESILNASEGEIEDIVRRDLATILGIRAQSTFCRVYKWKRAMAQYTVGHGARVERIRAQLAVVPGLALAGNAYGGIGVPDCIRSGSEAATKVVTDLGISSLDQPG